MMGTVTITVTDDATGEAETVKVPDNDYFLLCTGTCYQSSVQTYPQAGTHVLTIKGREGRGSHAADQRESTRA
jgi:long-subunit fatty acid transport protein